MANLCQLGGGGLWNLGPVNLPTPCWPRCWFHYFVTSLLSLGPVYKWFNSAYYHALYMFYHMHPDWLTLINTLNLAVLSSLKSEFSTWPWLLGSLWSWPHWEVPVIPVWYEWPISIPLATIKLVTSMRAHAPNIQLFWLSHPNHWPISISAELSDSHTSNLSHY